MMNVSEEALTFDKNNVSPAVIKRLPRYFRYLGELKEAGVERISSQEFAEQEKPVPHAFWPRH